MGKSFNEAEGQAQKTNIDYYTFTDGENRFRMFGDLLPRYVYWKATRATEEYDSKNVAIECLGFDRDKEKFTNVEKDWVQHYYPEDKCSWAYLIQVIDPDDGKIKVLGLKKKLFEQIRNAAEELGDPTDPETGYVLVVKRAKTGPLAFNVEYTLQVLKLKPTPLTDKEKKAIEDAPTIDKLLPRPSPEEQKAFIESRILASVNTKDGKPDVDADVKAEFDDDVAF